MDPLFVRALSRRRMLFAGAALVGAFGATGMARAAAAAGPSVLPTLRPDATETSDARCAACGSPDHTMLSGACLPQRLRA
ncbi:MAG TPA: hypothetical protein VFV59_08750 [Candidatus Limnocylindria bacterium]|nr:hypothetical protein [Candidatus Limnocylindria bacterium]